MDLLIKKSRYGHRYLFSGIFALVLLLCSAFSMADAFVLIKSEKPIMPVASLTFTPVPTTPDTTPVQNVYTDTQYTDSNIQLQITKVVKTNPNLVYYVADIRMNSLEYFKTGFANDTYGYHIFETLSSQAQRHNAILAINSDDCGYNNEKLTVRNGTLYKDNFSDEVLVLGQDGRMSISKGVPGATLVQQGAVHTWSFGPTLVKDGAYVDRTSTVSGLNPRTGLGMIAPYHYIFIVVDGRRPSHSAGLVMKDFAQLFLDYGCTVAYNLDGGGSSEMYFHNKIINIPDDGLSAQSPGKERKLTDIIYIGE